MRRKVNRRLAELHARRARRLARAGRWAASARAYERAIARHGRNRRWHIALAETYKRTGQWEAAARAYEGALALDDRRARVHAKLARARFRAHQWELAAAAYEQAIARNPRKPQWHAALARTREHMAQWDGTGAGQDGRAQARLARRRKRERQAARLGSDPRATELDRQLARASPARLGVRRGLGRFVTRHLDAIRDRALGAPRETRDIGFKVFVFWAQGVDAGPPIVRRCVEEMRRLHADDDIVFLDRGSAGEYATVPADVTRAMGRDWTRFSDALRLELLSTYGGVWMDPTCLPRARIQTVMPDLLSSGFFAFTYRHARLGNWFMASEPDHYIVALLREAYYACWLNFERLVDYYVFHHLFEVLYHLDDRFAALWDSTPRVPVSRATAYTRSLLEPYDAERARALLAGSFVHKLSHKIDPRPRPGSGLAHLIEDGPPVRS